MDALPFSILRNLYWQTAEMKPAAPVSFPPVISYEIRSPAATATVLTVSAHVSALGGVTEHPSAVAAPLTRKVMVRAMAVPVKLTLRFR